MVSFEKELQQKPEGTGPEITKRYKGVLESVRIRQRKLFRFTRYEFHACVMRTTADADDIEF